MRLHTKYMVEVTATWRKQKNNSFGFKVDFKSIKNGVSPS